MSGWKYVLIGLFILALSGCSENKETASPPVTVRTMTVSLGLPADHTVYSGSVRGRYESRRGFQVGGKIMARRVDLGTAVTAGQVVTAGQIVATLVRSGLWRWR
jgi:hypothetical protein